MEVSEEEMRGGCGERVDGGACNPLNFEHLAKSTRHKVDVFLM